jgi:uncharacterized protein DUF4129
VRSSGEARGRLIALALAAGVTALTIAVPVIAQPATVAGRLTDVETERALERVKADPNLATERTIKSLHWIGPHLPDREPRRPAWLDWMAGLLRWVNQSARALMWIVLIGLASWLVAYLARLFGTRQRIAGPGEFVPPTHVRDLDIRPETLPAEIGAAARALWERGEHRAAMALLYRGMLSRLAHVHHIPIRDSSTEGDCLSMAARDLTQRPRDYAVLLVRAWQRFVYGGEDVEPATVYALCRDFASSLDRSAVDAPARRGTA